jgi:plastocyanin
VLLEPRILIMHTVASPKRTSQRISDLRNLLRAGGSENSIISNVVYVVAAGFIVASAFIHLHLWHNGYRHIATIGPLFLAQVIAGFVIAAFVLMTRNVRSAGVAFGFVVSTLGGFLLSINVGLFGFKDSFSAPDAHLALLVEVAALVLLAAATGLSIRSRESSATPVVPSRPHSRVPNSQNRLWMMSGAAIIVLGIVALSLSVGGGGGSPSSSSASKPSSSSSSSTTVTISNYMFSPMTDIVKPGATISVTNKDGVAHTLTANNGAFNSGNIGPHQTKTFKAPTKPGTYSYICSIHQYMTGTIKVS